MPISKSEYLFALIKSLTRGEKRHFRSFAKRESEDGALKYLKLFEVIDKQDRLDENALAEQFEKRKLPNLKRHLYTQIMVCLRLLQRNENITIQLREFLDFANLLYGKGHYLQSLQIIEKAKNLAVKTNDELILLQLLEFEKIIESRHITRNGISKVSALTRETDKLVRNINNRLKFSNLRLNLHGRYIKYGHSRSREEDIEVKALYQERLESVDISEFALIEKAYYYQAKVWFHFILMEIDKCYDNAYQWLQLFKVERKYVHRDINLMMRAYHYILTCLYHLGRRKEYVKYLDEFENFRNDNYSKFNSNSQIISFIYVHNGRLNKYVLTKTYSEGLKIIPKTLSRIKRYKNNLDSHRILVLHFKIALLYIMAGNAADAIRYLNGIMNNKVNSLREDIQGFARIAFLMAHYDLENYDVIHNELKRIKKYFAKLSLGIASPNLMLEFFTKAVNSPIYERKKLEKDLATKLEKLFKDKYERRGILYLNANEWISDKINNKHLIAV